MTPVRPPFKVLNMRPKKASQDLPFNPWDVSVSWFWTSLCKSRKCGPIWPSLAPSPLEMPSNLGTEGPQFPPQTMDHGVQASGHLLKAVGCKEPKWPIRA
ncbi:hypothetical protein O181_006491 [Austropuccinia psidii MF-1]|uniref:Uncharacterized protein n=1 Tax=Austropuccinia psidii MF-1 TaxID=1389203 RepID=A0A9Q3BL01_9BASI|nr:hypothetical protein [Austropuccinia psidii MF-1]